LQTSFGFLRINRQSDAKGGSLARNRLDLDLAAMVLDDLDDDGQADPVPSPIALVVKKGRKSSPVFRRDSASVVGDCQINERPTARVRMLIVPLVSIACAAW